MQAMILKSRKAELELTHLPQPQPGPDELLLRVHACGVCRTDLHVVDGDLTRGKLPIIPGHEVVASVVACGSSVSEFSIGDRVGVPWLGWTCGACEYCLHGQENLCAHARFTGYDLDGGYAQYMLAHRRYCLPLPSAYDDASAAPLLCAGLIGYRALIMAGDAHRLGIYGFGAAAHIVAQIARYQHREVYAFTRPDDAAAQAFARQLGAAWAGDSNVAPPHSLDAAIIFAPVGALVVNALRAVRKGGTVVCAGIHMSDIPSFPYELLWGERCVRSVANLTRRDGVDFLALAPLVPVRTTVVCFPLCRANEALACVREGRITGAAVLLPPQSSEVSP
ncbi:MAG TPA: zinc-dependent alcohol dehydrogenase family protein [Burkholderiales bacterium]|nr:zinc-dependent alcohol dehydrogenase family protein [Burkholderiales bacterium]